MATQTPIPPNPIGESFAWREWFQRLSNRVFGDMSDQDSNAVFITGGVIDGTSIGATTPDTGAFTTLSATTPIAVASGGTGANTASAARTNLGVAYGPAFSAYPGTTQIISSGGTLVKVNFGTEEFDTNNNFSSSRFTPTVAGYYQVNSAIRLDGGGPGTGECMIVVFKNGSEAKRGWNSEGTSFANNFFSLSVSAVVYCNGSTDYLEIYAQQVSGSDRNISPYANISYFQAFLARPA
jgi:hypothetical protein